LGSVGKYSKYVCSAFMGLKIKKSDNKLMDEHFA
jgi:hypothetical protein